MCNNTFFAVKYYQCLDSYQQKKSVVTTLSTPPPYIIQISHSCQSPLNICPPRPLPPPGQLPPPPGHLYVKHQINIGGKKGMGISLGWML